MASTVASVLSALKALKEQVRALDYPLKVLLACACFFRWIYLSNNALVVDAVTVYVMFIILSKEKGPITHPMQLVLYQCACVVQECNALLRKFSDSLSSFCAQSHTSPTFQTYTRNSSEL